MGRNGEREILEQLATVRLDRPIEIGSALDLVRSAFGDAWVLAYRPALTAQGWGFETLHLSGHAQPEDFRRTVSRALSQGMPEGTEPALYNPLRPDADQRNRVIGSAEIRRISAGRDAFTQRLYPKLGLDRLDEARTLVCDGSLLLTWLGIFRDRPLEARDRRRLALLSHALRKRLVVERALFGPAHSKSSLDLALDALPRPAVIVSARGRVEAANRLAIDWLARSGEERRAILEQGGRGVLKAPGWRATPLADGAASGLVLLEGPAPHGDRLTAFAARHGLTPRQREVAGRIFQGESNKDIAARLGCSIGTVEAHVTAILYKARVSTRAELAASFWAD